VLSHTIVLSHTLVKFRVFTHRQGFSCFHTRKRRRSSIVYLHTGIRVFAHRATCICTLGISIYYIVSKPYAVQKAP